MGELSFHQWIESINNEKDLLNRMSHVGFFFFLGTAGHWTKNYHRRQAACTNPYFQYSSFSFTQYQYPPYYVFIFGSINQLKGNRKMGTERAGRHAAKDCRLESNPELLQQGPSLHTRADPNRPNQHLNPTVYWFIYLWSSVELSSHQPRYCVNLPYLCPQLIVVIWSFDITHSDSKTISP